LVTGIPKTINSVCEEIEIWKSRAAIFTRLFIEVVSLR
jgi:hypothetical protein